MTTRNWITNLFNSLRPDASFVQPEEPPLFKTAQWKDPLRIEHDHARICNMSFEDRSVMLGDTDFIRCRFVRCSLIDDGPFSMDNCFMDACAIQSANAGRQQAVTEPSGERRSKRTMFRRSGMPKSTSIR